MLTLAGGLGGCDFFGSGGKQPLLPLPESLATESQAFIGSAGKSWVWEERAEGSGGDTLLTSLVWRAARGDDTLVDGIARPRLALYRMNGALPVPTSANTPAPVGAWAALGFRTDRIAFDSAAAPDPGFAWPLPDLPMVGWRADATVEDARLVRAYAGVRTISASGKRHACWCFADSVFETGGEGALLAHGSACFGATGLVQREVTVPGYVTASGRGGSLIRTITALP